MTANSTHWELKNAISREFKEELTPIILPTLNWAIPKEGKDEMDCGWYRPISVLKG
jgi:hypothetical protein